MIFWLNLWTALITTMLLVLEIRTLVRRRRTPPYPPVPGPAVVAWTPGKPLGQTWLAEFDHIYRDRK